MWAQLWSHAIGAAQINVRCLLFIKFSIVYFVEIAHFNTANPLILSNKPVKCEVDRRNAFRGYVNVHTENYGLNPNIKSGLLM